MHTVTALLTTEKTRKRIFLTLFIVAISILCGLSSLIVNAGELISFLLVGVILASLILTKRYLHLPFPYVLIGLAFPIYETIYNIIVSSHPALQGVFKIIDRWPLVVLVILAIKYRDSTRENPRSVFIWAWFFIAVCFLSSIFVAITQSLQIGLGGLSTDIAPILVYMFASQIPVKSPSLRPIIKAIVWTCGISAIIGLYIRTLGIAGLERMGLSLYYGTSQWGAIYGWGNFLRFNGFSYAVRAVGLNGSPISLSAFLLVGFSLCFYEIRENNGLKKALYATISAITLVCIYYTYTRSALVSIIVFLFVWQMMRSKRPLKISILAVVGIFLSILAGFVFNIATIENLFSLTAYSGSLYVHITQIPHYLSRMITHPFGEGIGMVGISAIRNGISSGGIEGWYFQIGDELGIVGVIAFLGLYINLILMFIRAWRKEEDREIKDFLCMCVGLLCALGVFNMALPLWSDPSTTMLFWGLLMGSATSYVSTSHHQSEEIIRSQ